MRLRACPFWVTCWQRQPKEGKRRTKRFTWQSRPSRPWRGTRAADATPGRRPGPRRARPQVSADVRRNEGVIMAVAVHHEWRARNVMRATIIHPRAIEARIPIHRNRPMTQRFRFGHHLLEKTRHNRTSNHGIHLPSGPGTPLAMGRLPDANPGRSQGRARSTRR